MGQSCSNVLVHFVFSTKQRSPWLGDAWRQELHSVIASIVQKQGTNPVIVNSVNDHVHMLIPLSRTVSIADLMKVVKGKTSEWIHGRFPNLRVFQWQGGYGAFSVSPSHKEAMVHYIATQQEHHKTVSFQDEFRRLLEIYKVTYDEAYLWD